MAPGPTAEVWYSLFNLYTTAAIAINIIIIAFFLYFLFRYSRQPVKGEPSSIDAKKLALVFVVVSAIIFYSLEFYTLSAMRFVEEVPSDPDLVIEVQAFQWAWKFIYPNGTASVGTLKVPKGAVILFKVTSLDVHHKFGIPALKASVDAVPGRVNYLWVRFDEAGTYTVRCYELCGVGHADMIGKIIVE